MPGGIGHRIDLLSRNQVVVGRRYGAGASYPRLDVGQLGRAFNGDMAFSDALRELRLQPVVRLGVSYKF